MATAFPTRISWRGDRPFFTGMAAAFVIIVFIGFAPTYYLSRFTGAPTVSALVHLHSIIYTGWVLLFLAHVGLLPLGQKELHRRMGMAMAAFAIAVVIVGVVTALESGRLGNGPPDRHQPSFLVFPLTNMVTFSAFTALGVVYRERAAYHKRLMLLGTMGLIITPLARISRMLELPFKPPAIGGMLLSDLFLLALVLFDLKKRGKLHPVTLWGGGAYLLSQPIRVAIGQTDAWQSFARLLIG